MQNLLAIRRPQYLIQPLDSGQMHPFINSSSHLHKHAFKFTSAHFTVSSVTVSFPALRHPSLNRSFRPYTLIHLSVLTLSHALIHWLIHLFTYHPKQQHLLMYLPTKILIDSSILSLNLTLFHSPFLSLKHTLIYLAISSLNHTFNFPLTQTHTLSLIFPLTQPHTLSFIHLSSHSTTHSSTFPLL
jgi:hypothetical protein